MFCRNTVILCCSISDGRANITMRRKMSDIRISVPLWLVPNDRIDTGLTT